MGTTKDIRCCRTELLESDFKLIENDGIDMKEFAGASFLVTGSTGLVGSLFTKALLYFNRIYKLGLGIYAVVRNIDKAGAVFEDDFNDSALRFVVTEDIGNGSFDITEKVDYIVHAAAITNSKEMVTNPSAVLISAFNSTHSLLEIAKRNNATMVYISSMEIYGTIDNSESTKENDLGYINLSSIRSCYPESKRMCECLCNAYAHQFGVRVMSARLAQTFGAGILPSENRVFAQFARSAVSGNNIVLHTMGLSEGNYVYVAEALRAILILIKKGSSGEAYNICDPESHTTIGAMAEMVAEKFSDGKIKVVRDIPKDSLQYGYAPDTKLFLDNSKMKLLGWNPVIHLDQMYRRLIEWIKIQQGG